MPTPCRTVIEALHDLCPPRFALEGDATGLQVGSPEREVSRVLCTLDLTLEVAEEARARRAGLIVSHHAVVFRPLRDLRVDSFKGRILETLIKGDVSVYVPHTAMDVVEGGQNDHLARTVGLAEATFLEETGREEKVLLLGRRPGDSKAFETRLYLEGAESIQVLGDLVEVVAPRASAGQVASRMEFLQQSPPRVMDLSGGATRRGIGRIGRLAQPQTVRDLAARLKADLQAPGVRVAAPDLGKRVERVAVLGGDGRRYVRAALAAGAEALVTGDLDHHTALEARASGLALIDVGHWASERPVVPLLVAGLTSRLEDQDVTVLASEVDTQPFTFV